ncbi:MAG: butyrate kinase [Bacteroidota bacterium]
MNQKLLVINPGSTSTRIAVYSGLEPEFLEVIAHSSAALSIYQEVFDQYEFRKNLIYYVLKEKGVDLREIVAVVGRGGLCKPIPSGVYEVNEQMLQDLRTSAFGKHVSSLSGLIAHEIAKELGVKAYIVDPVVVNEFEPLAYYSGWPEIRRKSLFHALNQKAAARKAAESLGRDYRELRLIVAHLGGGITIGVHKYGRVVDVNNGLEEGPFAPERSGSLPIGDLIRLCFSGKYSKDSMIKTMAGKGGLVAYLGTNNGREVEQRISAGDAQAAEVFEAMAYQVAKEIGADATVLNGQVDAIVLTGGLAYSERFVEWLKQRVGFIAPIIVLPGEFEMEALASGAWRVLTGREEAKIYAPTEDWSHYVGF